MRIGPVAGRPGRKQSPADEQRRKAAITLIERYDARLRRTARRYSLCAADADDAYQRALEILLTKAPDVEPDRLLRWMHTVTRHEAYAVRRQRDRLLGGHRIENEGGESLDPIEQIASDAPEPDIDAERKERTTRGFEALNSLKPQEIRTLTLKAEGYSYNEIAEITGFSLTKINRCMVEGRKSFLEKFAAIEGGERCEQLSAELSAFSDGELEGSEQDQAQLLDHLEGCAHCRAKLREYRGVPQRVLALAPILSVGAPSLSARAGDRVSNAAERIREVGNSLLHKTTGAVDASQAVAATGGPKGSSLALVGIVCGLGAAGGGAAYCVDQGVLPNPLGVGSPAIEKPLDGVEAAPVEPAPEPGASEGYSADDGRSTGPTAAEARRRQLGISSEPNDRGETREFGGSAPGGSAAPTSGGSAAGASGAGKENFGL